MMAVDVTPGDELGIGRPRPVIDPWTVQHNPVRGYDVFPDGSFVRGIAGEELPDEVVELHVHPSHHARGTP